MNRKTLKIKGTGVPRICTWMQILLERYAYSEISGTSILI